jgi:hypothetical protein
MWKHWKNGITDTNRKERALSGSMKDSGHTEHKKDSDGNRHGDMGTRKVSENAAYSSLHKKCTMQHDGYPDQWGFWEWLWQTP